MDLVANTKNKNKLIQKRNILFMDVYTDTSVHKTNDVDFERRTSGDISKPQYNDGNNRKMNEKAVAIPIIEEKAVPSLVEKAFSSLLTKEPHREWKLLKKQVQPLPLGSSFNDVYLVNSDVKLSANDGPTHQKIAVSVNEDLRSFLANNYVTVGEASNKNYNMRSSIPIKLYTRIVWMEVGGYGGRFVGGKLAIAWVLASGRNDHTTKVHAGRKLFLRSYRPLHPVACLFANEEMVIRSMGLKLANRILKDLQNELNR